MRHAGFLGGALVVAYAGVTVWAQQAPAPAAPAARTAPVPPGLPDWAYTPPVPGAGPAVSALPTDDSAIVRLPGVEPTLTRGQLRGQVEIPDWYPNEHVGAMPAVVKNGRQGVRACGFCHTADGSGRPENASVNGLPVEYFIQQMADFKTGHRGSADPRKNNTKNMIAFAVLATPEEVRAAAEYFAAQPYRKRLRVVESKTAPKVRMQGGMHMAIVGEGAGMEPIGNQIVEVPEDALRAEARDVKMDFIAYVPVGAIKKGKALATAGQCATCHGANFEGLGPVPPIAGRSPSYTMRQMLDMKLGARKGPWAALMKTPLNKLSNDDLMHVSAYLASLDPGAARATSTH